MPVIPFNKIGSAVSCEDQHKNTGISASSPNFGVAPCKALHPGPDELDQGEVAERTGLEPATSGVTGRRSNQLSYRSALPVRTAGR